MSSGQVGEPCLRSSDCLDGLCCARHFWTRICKPVLQEGQVCTRHRRKGNHGLELFQRCPCGDGLSCRTLRDPRTASSSKMAVSLSSSSSSSSLLMAAAKSKFTSSSPSSSHLLSPLSTSAKSSAVASKTRLHVCQKNWTWTKTGNKRQRRLNDVQSSGSRVFCIFWSVLSITNLCPCVPVSRPHQEKIQFGPHLLLPCLYWVHCCPENPRTLEKLVHVETEDIVHSVSWRFLHFS